MSDFSDRPFVAGSLVGLRAFKVDKYGRLYGVTVNEVFRPGDNEAECFKERGNGGLTYSSMFARIGASMSAQPMTYSYGGLTSSSYLTSPALAPSADVDMCPCGCGLTRADMVEIAAPDEQHTLAHSVAAITCTCGYYAYFDGRNDYKEPTNVSALIEGFGVCTVGDRGFRAAKARLVALVEPKAKVSPLVRQRLHANYPDVPFFDSRRAAVDAHPLTPPPVPGPEDDDFWTRKVGA